MSEPARWIKGGTLASGRVRRVPHAHLGERLEGWQPGGWWEKSCTVSLQVRH